MSQTRLNVIGAVGIFVVVAYAFMYSLPIALALLLWGLVATAAYKRTSAAVVIGLAMIAIIPIYWAPNFPGTTIASSPVIFVCAVLMPAAVEQRKKIRIGAMDRFVLGFTFITALGYLVNSKGAAGSIAASLLSVLFPYATFRLLAMRKQMSTFAAYGVILGGVVSAFIAVREYQGWPNPFFKLFPGGHAHQFFARADTRLGHPRPEASFGQAIALGMFLVLAIVLALGLAWGERNRARLGRAVLYLAAGAMVYALTENLVRGPIIMLAFAVVVLLIRESRRGHYGRGILVAGALVILVNVGSFANVLQLRDQTFDQTSRVGASGDYRLEIWRVVTDRSNFSLVGKQVVDEDGLGYTKASGVDVGLKSFDNAYALIYIGFGLLALLAFIGIGLRVAKAALVDGLQVVDHAWAAALLAAFINLMTVNLLTQFAHVFWIGIGLVASAIQLSQDAAAAEKLVALPGIPAQSGRAPHQN